jgi:hypothetical protein
MGVDVSHLVSESLGDTDDQVVDEGSDSAESGDVLARTMVELDVDDARLGLGEVDRDVAQVLDELALRVIRYVCSHSRISRYCIRHTSGTLDGHDSGLDRDLDCRTEVSTAALQATNPSHPIQATGSSFEEGENLPPSGTSNVSSEWMYFILTWVVGECRRRWCAVLKSRKLAVNFGARSVGSPALR